MSAGLHRVVPALPVRDVPASVAHLRTAFGTREFATSDLDGNLLSFFRFERT